MSDRIFKGVVVDGVLVVNTHGSLPDGAEFEVVEDGKRLSVRPTKGKNGRAKTRGKTADPMPGFGALKDKPEWKGRSGAEIARELRRTSSRRSGRA